MTLLYTEMCAAKEAADAVRSLYTKRSGSFEYCQNVLPNVVLWGYRHFPRNINHHERGASKICQHFPSTYELTRNVWQISAAGRHGTGWTVFCVHVALFQSPRKSTTWCSRSVGRPATSRLAHHERGCDFVESAQPKWYRCLLQPASKQTEGMQALQGLRGICDALSHNLATRVLRIISSGATSGITCIIATRTLFGRG